MDSLARWLARRSLKSLHRWGAVLGWAVWSLSPVYRRRLRDHADLAGVPAPQRRLSVAEAGKTALELPRLWLRPPGHPIADPIEWEAQALIEEALAAGRGLLFLTPHLGSFELSAQAYAQHYGHRQPMTVLYRPSRKPWLRQLEERARQRPGLATAPASLAGVRQLMRALHQGQTVGLLPDQVPPLGQGVWAPFFGRPAYTMTLAARLAQHTGAAVLLALCERLPEGRGYRIRLRRPGIELPARPQPGGAPQAEQAWAQQSAAVVNCWMEALIRECPQQYFWSYNRYKAPRVAD